MELLSFELNSGDRLAVNSAKARRVTENGREYIVAPMTLIVPGVLSGSQGALYYPPEEVAKNPGVWNGYPLLHNHPQDPVSGRHLSGNSPGVKERWGLGEVRNDRIAPNGKRRADGWFDVEAVKRVHPPLLQALESGSPIELSTGLYSNYEKAWNGAHHNGRPYNHVARDYIPDHVAILTNEPGACSNRDGCGVHVVNSSSIENKHSFDPETGLCVNCGGPGGKPGPCPTHSHIYDPHGHHDALEASGRAIHATRNLYFTPHKFEKAGSAAEHADKMRKRALFGGNQGDKGKARPWEAGRSEHMKLLEKAHLKAMSAHYEAIAHHEGNEAARTAHKEALAKHEDAYIKVKRAKESMAMVGNEAVENKLDKQGGELPVISKDELQHADFVTLPKGIPGTNCSNCRFVKAKGDGHVCTNEHLEGQAVTNRNCCAYWDATGTLREWEKVENAAEHHERAAAAHGAERGEGHREAADAHREAAKKHRAAASLINNSEVTNMYGESPKELSRQAAVASMDHPDAREHALKAADAAREGMSDKAARFHGKAAEVHDQMALAARKDKEPDEADVHDRIAMMHRKAKSMHEAGVRNSEEPTSIVDNQEQPMTREMKIAALTVNCSCDKERAVFNEMKDETLDAVFKAAVQNGQPSKSSPNFSDTQGSGSKQVGGEEEVKDKSKVNNQLTLTAFESMLAASPEAQSVWNTAKQITQRAKEDMVRRLVANVKDDKRRTEMATNLLQKSPAQLQEMLELLPPPAPVVNQQQQVPTPQLGIDFSFLGAAGGPPSGPVVNAAETPVEVTEEWMPTLNYEEIAREQRNEKKSA